MNSIFEIATKISSPLALAGLFAAILFFVIRQIIAAKLVPGVPVSKAYEVIKLFIDRLFVLALVAMTLGFIGWIWIAKTGDDKDVAKISASEKYVLDQEDGVMRLRGAWENMDNSPADLEKVRNDGPSIASNILGVPDGSLRPAYAIVKYEYGLYALTMCASVTPTNGQAERELKLQFADNGINCAAKALALIQTAREIGPSDASHRQALDYINSEEVEDRVNYLDAICYCRKYDATHDVACLNNARGSISKVSKTHLIKFPIDKNPEFAVISVK